MFNYFALIAMFSAIFFTSCFDSKANEWQKTSITRKHDSCCHPLSPPQKQKHEPYVWEQNTGISKITKEYFRCMGNPSNLPIWIEKERIADCGGISSHSLPLRDEQEFIYPILIDLLNYIQNQTKKKVIITSGHRCPQHNKYVDPAKENQYSKHMIGAEVSFYLQEMIGKEEEIVKLIIDYYKEKPEEYSSFIRYEKEDTNVETKPWYNKEIFIKLFKSHEGRNRDNIHPYPYLSIQVRFDSFNNEKVSYSWDQAFNNYLRK